MQYKVLEDPETLRLGYYAYEHPLRSYKRFIKRHARTNFAELRVLSAGDPKTFKNLVRRERPNVHIRVKSQEFRNSKQFEEFTLHECVEAVYSAVKGVGIQLNRNSDRKTYTKTNDRFALSALPLKMKVK